MIEMSSQVMGNELSAGAQREASDANKRKSKITGLKYSSLASKSPQASVCSLVCGVYVTNEKQHGSPVVCR